MPKQCSLYLSPHKELIVHVITILNITVMGGNSFYFFFFPFNYMHRHVLSNKIKIQILKIVLNIEERKCI